MDKTFIEMKFFQVKPDRLEQFEAKIEEMSANQRSRIRAWNLILSKALIEDSKIVFHNDKAQNE